MDFTYLDLNEQQDWAIQSPSLSVLASHDEEKKVIDTDALLVRCSHSVL